MWFAAAVGGISPHTGLPGDPGQSGCHSVYWLCGMGSAAIPVQRLSHSSMAVMRRQSHLSSIAGAGCTRVSKVRPMCREANRRVAVRGWEESGAPSARGSGWEDLLQRGLLASPNRRVPLSSLVAQVLPGSELCAGLPCPGLRQEGVLSVLGAGCANAALPTPLEVVFGLVWTERFVPSIITEAADWPMEKTSRWV